MITTGNESSWHLAGEARMLLNILRRGGQPPTINVNSARFRNPGMARTAPLSEDLVLGVFLISKQGMKHLLHRFLGVSRNPEHGVN